MDDTRPAEQALSWTLSRRRLLAHGGLWTAFTLTGLSSCTPPASDTARQEPAGDASGIPPFELEEISLSQLQEGMTSGRFTARSITELYLERIAQLDRQGPTLGSVIETNPDALVIANALDEERIAQGPRGPLHGIPVLLKDNIATHDRTTTTAGSWALAGSIPAQDSFVARRLREAGAVLLGKANLSEWANFRSTRSSSGWSGRGGQCRNPYALNRSPCGSSSGSGAATSGNLTAVAIGTETNGSIVCPSSANGLVGVKPTVGLVSRSRIIPISHSQDTAGPMARSVRDAAIVLGALTGVDPEDPATAASEGQALDDYTSFLDVDGLRGARIGVARSFFSFNPKVAKVMEDALEVIRQQGAELIDPVEIPSYSELGQHSFQVLLYEFKAGLNAYLTALGPDAPVKSLAEIIAFNEAHSDQEMPFFEQELFLQAEEKGPLDSQEYLDALTTSRRLARQEGIDKVMDEHHLDAILAPTGGPAWTLDPVNGDHFGGGSSTAAAVAGYPNVTVPAGFVHGLPIGVSFFGRAWSEPTLLKIAYGFEQTTHHRQAPRFLPHLELI